LLLASGAFLTFCLNLSNRFIALNSTRKVRAALFLAHLRSSLFIQLVIIFRFSILARWPRILSKRQ